MPGKYPMINSPLVDLRPQFLLEKNSAHRDGPDLP